MLALLIVKTPLLNVINWQFKSGVLCFACHFFAFCAASYTFDAGLPASASAGAAVGLLPWQISLAKKPWQKTLPKKQGKFLLNLLKITYFYHSDVTILDEKGFY